MRKFKDDFGNANCVIGFVCAFVFSFLYIYSSYVLLEHRCPIVPGKGSDECFQSY